MLVSKQHKKNIDKDGETSSKSAEPLKLPVLRSRLTRSDSAPLMRHKMQFDAHLKIPDKSIMKPTEHSLFMRGLRKRTVSFSTLLTEEIEEIKEHSDSDSDNEGNDSSLQESHAEEDEDDFMAKENLESPCSDLDTAKCEESSNVGRPPTPPNASHLVKPITIENLVSVETDSNTP